MTVDPSSADPAMTTRYKVPIDIITCPEWGAVRPKSPPVMVPKSTEIIFHHTAGHHAEIENPQNESWEESVRYARAIQHFHMEVRGWNDSGHNFLVCRNGLILQGRWMTVSGIQEFHMVHSAHCPGKNTQIGIEHEHKSGEQMTKAQRQASATLMAWIAGRYGRRTILPVYPHKRFYATSCPDNLIYEIPYIQEIAKDILLKAVH